MAHFTDLIYTHQKTGKFYRIVNFAIAENTLQPIVIYKGLLDGAIWARPACEFFDGRFVTGGAEPGAAQADLSLQTKDVLRAVSGGVQPPKEEPQPQFPTDEQGYPLDEKGFRMMTMREVSFRQKMERKNNPVQPDEAVSYCITCDGSGLYRDGHSGKEKCAVCGGDGLMVYGGIVEDDGL